MKGMFLEKCHIYCPKWATVVQKFQLSMTKLGTLDEIRWFDGTYWTFTDPEQRWWGARSNSDSDSWANLLTQVQISGAQAPHPTAKESEMPQRNSEGTTLTWSHLFLLSVKATTGSLSWRCKWSTRVSQIPFSCWGPTRSFTPFPPCCCFPFDSRSFFASIACAQGGEWRLSGFGTGRTELNLLRFCGFWAVRQWSGFGTLVLVPDQLGV